MEYLLISFLLMAVFLIVLFVSIYFFQKRKRNDFDNWLSAQGFIVSQKIGGVLRHYFFKNTYCLLVDIANKKICKHFEQNIFDFTEILGAEINKDNVVVTTTQSDTSGKIKAGIILPRAKFNGNTNSKSIMKDDSTYEVYIRTNNILNSLIIIPCGKNGNEAARVYSCIESILNSSEK